MQASSLTSPAHPLTIVGQVLGPTDPSTAPPDSLRGQIMSGWEGLGLAAPPNTGDNGVHASASPFEGPRSA